MRAAKARIDVGRGEIRFRVGKEDMFFRFKHREEQRFLIHQDSDGQALWGEPFSQPEPHPEEEEDRRRCGGTSRARLRPILQDNPNVGK